MNNYDPYNPNPILPLQSAYEQDPYAELFPNINNFNPYGNNGIYGNLTPQAHQGYASPKQFPYPQGHQGVPLAQPSNQYMGAMYGQPNGIQSPTPPEYNPRFSFDALQPMPAHMMPVDIGQPEAMTKATPVDKTTDTTKKENPWDSIYPLFGGVDTNTAMFKVGQGLAFNTDNLNLSEDGKRQARTGNTIMTIGAIGKSLLGTSRNVLAGVGFEKRRQEIMRDAMEKQRKKLRGEYENIAEDGGTYADGGFHSGTNFTSEIRDGRKYINGKPVLTQEEYMRRKVATGTGVKLTNEAVHLQSPTTGQFIPEAISISPTFRGLPLTQGSTEMAQQQVEQFNQLPHTGVKKSVTSYPISSYGMTTEQMGTLPEEQFSKLVGAPEQPRVVTINGQKYVNGKPVLTKEQYTDMLQRTGGREIGVYPYEVPQQLVDTRRIQQGQSSLDFVRQLRDGGEIMSTAKKLTGEYVQGLSESQQKQYAGTGELSEVEVDEHILTNEDEVLQVVGKKHEQGGEKMLLEDGTRVISDNLKFNPAQAKNVRDSFGLGVKTTDTYAKSLKKYTDKIGLTKLNEEQEELIKQVEKQQKNKDATTTSLNIDYLSGEIKRIEDDKKPLLDARLKFSDYIFDLQESSKPQEDTMIKLENGGTIDKGTLAQVSAKYGLSLEQGLELIQNMETEKFSEGGEKGYSLRANKFAKDKYGHQATTDFGFGDLTTEEQRTERMKHLLELTPTGKQFFNIKKDADGKITSITPKDKSAVLKFQNHYNKVTDAYVSYVKGKYKDDPDMPKFVESVLAERFSDEKGKVESKDNLLGNRTTSRAGYGDAIVSPEELKKLNEAGVTNLSDITDMAKYDFLSDKSKANITEAKAVEGNDFMLGAVPLVAAPAAPTTPEEKAAVEKTKVPADNSQTATDGFKNVTPRNEFEMPMLADQSVLPPDALVPHVKINRRFDNIDPVAITNEENIKQIDAQTQFAARQLNNLPDSQNKAVLANLIASSVDNINKSIVQVAATNAANVQQVDQLNIGQRSQEVNTAAVDALDFEKRQLTALGMTNEDIRNYFDYNQKVAISNRNDIQRFNLYNDLYDNYKVTPFGTVGFDASNPITFNGKNITKGNGLTNMKSDLTNLTAAAFKKAYGSSKEDFQKQLRDAAGITNEEKTA